MRNNVPLQEAFAQLTVPPPVESQQSTSDKTNGDVRVYVIDGLLDLILNLHDLSAFDVRFAACECLKAYFSNHEEVKLHFLSRAIEGHHAAGEESANVLTVLLRPTDTSSPSDPYRHWFAAVIMFHLLFDNYAAKMKAQHLTEGDSSSGEEVVTSIQTISAHLIAGIFQLDDQRILVGYLMLLLGWLFENLAAVNDFLTEGSNVQSLVQVLSRPVRQGDQLIYGLCAMLLGVAYEFSTKDSPIPRATLHNILISRLGRDSYLEYLAKLRAHPFIRDYEVTSQKLAASSQGALPNVLFDAVFINFFKDNYSRISRAIDRNPELEISVITNGVQEGISRELVDSLRSRLKTKDQVLEEMTASMKELEKRLGQERADYNRSKEQAASDMAAAQKARDSSQRVHEAEVRLVLTNLDRSLLSLILLQKVAEPAICKGY